jgi:hypothetical protein
MLDVQVFAELPYTWDRGSVNIIIKTKRGDSICLMSKMDQNHLYLCL